MVRLMPGPWVQSPGLVMYFYLVEMLHSSGLVLHSYRSSLVFRISVASACDDRFCFSFGVPVCVGTDEDASFRLLTSSSVMLSV